MNVWWIPVVIILVLAVIGTIASIGAVHLIRYVKLRRRYQRLVDERDTQNRVL